ncbi:MAG: hypothetical protein ACFFCW_09970 [Candidatus Hodarchaeota archaeon]
MSYVYEVKLSEVISQLPEILPLNVERNFSIKDDMFLCALGFEDRCTQIPRLLAEKSKYKSKEAIFFEYSTNIEDNDINRSELMTFLNSFSELVNPMQCDVENFVPNLRQTFLRICQKEDCPKITFDISSCSSKLLLSVMKILLESNIELRIVYSEANVYHPTKSEIEKNEKSVKKGALSKGVAEVLPSSEHPGYNLDALPDAVIAFATFNPERTKSMIVELDESLLEMSEDRVNWVLGHPHHPKDAWRSDYLKEINKISDTAPLFKESTFYYKNTLTLLYKLWQKNFSKYHLNISPLGSKMQSLAISLFHYIKPDITITFSPPLKYDASNFSEGCKATWMIDLGSLGEIRNALDEVGIIKIKSRKK